MRYDDPFCIKLLNSANACEEHQITKIVKRGDEGAATVRDKLIEVAAVHFAEHGLQGASQRAIQREVGVNPGAAHYHFGSKEALYLAVIEDALQRIQAGRTQLLKDFEIGQNGSGGVRRLLNAYLAPMLREATTVRGHSYLRILVAQLSHADMAREAMEAQVQEVRERYIDHFSRIFPAVSRNRLYEILRVCLSVAAIVPIQFTHEQLSEQKIETMIGDITEITAVIFDRMCNDDG